MRCSIDSFVGKYTRERIAEYAEFFGASMKGVRHYKLNSAEQVVLMSNLQVSYTIKILFS